MRKLFCILLCCILLTASAAAADIVVNSLNTKCTVQSNGDLEIKQEIALQVNKPTPEITLPVGADVSNVSVTGAESSLRQTDGNTYMTLRAEENFSGELSVTVSYRKKAAIQAEEDGQLFTAELVSGLWEREPERYTFSLVFPKNITGKPKFISGYQRDLDNELTVVHKGRTVSGFLRGGLQNHEYFRMELRMPPGYFTDFAPPSGVSHWTIAFLMLALFGLGVFYWLRFLRSGRLRPSLRSLPPDGVTAAELPYLLCGEKPDFSLLLFEWAADGYLTITQNRTGRIMLRKSMPMHTERRDFEQRLFRELFVNSDDCMVGSPRYCRVSEAASRMLKNYWTRIAFTRDSGNPMILRILASLISALAMLNTMYALLSPAGAKWPLLAISFVAGAVCGTLVWYGLLRWTVRDRLWFGLGIAAFFLLFLLSRSSGFVLMLAALAVDVLVAFATRSGGKRTASGSDVIEQCLGFSRFLGQMEEEHLQSMILQDPLYFYRIMIYACACGADRHVAQKSPDTLPEPCEWFTAAEGTSTSAPEFCRQLRNLRRAMK